MGDNLVLLTGEEGGEVESLIKEENGWGKELFDYIQPWNPLMIPQRLIVWLRCEGLPLSLWTKPSFEALVRKFGDLMAIDECSSSF